LGDLDDIRDGLDMAKIVKDAEDFAKEGGRVDNGKVLGKRVTRDMILEASMSDELREVQTLLLRDKQIAVFDDNINDGLELNELVNVECVFASHNMIKDIYGICSLVTLVELNLSFNLINDLSGIEELTQLRQLHLNHNRIVIIDPLENLQGIKVLSLMHN